MNGPFTGNSGRFVKRPYVEKIQEEQNMSSAGDFVIENGVLKQYTGPGGDVVIPEGVTKISGAAFEESDPITSLSIPNGVTEIGAETFRDQFELSEVILPDGLQKIGSNAFNGCKKLKKLVVPSSLSSIGRYAFRACRNLTELHISDIASWCRITLKDKYAHPLYEAKFGLDAVISYSSIFNREEKEGSLFCGGEPVRHLEIRREFRRSMRSRSVIVQILRASRSPGR